MNKLASLTLVAGLGALSFTACGGSDGGGGGSAEGFCDSLVRLDDSGADPDEDFDGAIAALEDLKSNAPGELKGDLDDFISVMKRIDGAAEDIDLDEIEADIEKMSTAITNIQAYANNNCEGLPADIFG